MKSLTSEQKLELDMSVSLLEQEELLRKWGLRSTNIFYGGDPKIEALCKERRQEGREGRVD